MPGIILDFKRRTSWAALLTGVFLLGPLRGSSNTGAPVPAPEEETRMERPDKSGWFDYQGKKVFLLGANYPWYTGGEGLDLGYLKGDKAILSNALWDQGGHVSAPHPSERISTGATRFDAAGIEAHFRDMSHLGVHAVRWFWGSDGRGFFELDKDNNCLGMDAATLQNVDKVVRIAERYHVLLIPVLLDSTIVFGPNHVLYEGSRSLGGESRKDVIQDAAKRKLLFDNYFKALAGRYKDSNAILYWEIMNEAGNAVQGTDPTTGITFKGNGCGIASARGCHVTVDEMRVFLNEAYDAIRSVDAKHPIMPSGLARPWQLPLVVGSVKADLYGAHYKDYGEQYAQIQTVAQIKQDLFRKYGLDLNKPLVMTEGPAEIDGRKFKHFDIHLTKAYQGGWAGYLPWTYQDMIGVDYYRKRPREGSTSANANAAHIPNIRFFRQFNQAHLSDVSL